VRALASTFLARLFGAGAVIALGAAAARWFGRAPRGTLEVLIDLRLGVHALGSMGLPAATTWAVARDPSASVPAARNALGAGLLLGAVAAVVLAVGVLLVPDRFEPVGVPWALAFVAASPAVLATLLAGGVLLGAGRVGAWNSLTVVNRGLLLVTIAVAALPPLRHVGTLMAGLVVAELATLALAWRYLGELGPGAATPGLDRGLLASWRTYGRRAWTHGALAWAFVRADVLLLLALPGPAETGSFAAGALAREVILFMPWIAGMLLLPRVAAKEAGRGPGAPLVGVHVAWVTLTAAALLLVFAREFVVFVHGPQFGDAAATTRVLVVAGLVLGLGNLCLQSLLGRGAPRVVVVAPAVALAVSVAGNLVAIPRAGALGAAWVALGSAAVLFAIAGTALRRLTRAGAAAPAGAAAGAAPPKAG
jgi:O-antigen/teichoic acid export membrane protein